VLLKQNSFRNYKKVVDFYHWILPNYHEPHLTALEKQMVNRTL
jgi:hypothetical protein